MELAHDTNIAIIYYELIQIVTEGGEKSIYLLLHESLLTLIYTGSVAVFFVAALSR